MQFCDNRSNAQILENAILFALYHIYGGSLTDTDLKPLRMLLKDTKKLNEYLYEFEQFLTFGENND